MQELPRWIMRLGFTVVYVLLVALACSLTFGLVWLAVHLLGINAALLFPLVFLIGWGWLISDGIVKKKDD